MHGAHEFVFMIHRTQQVFRRDVATIAAGGFKNVGLRVSFGELITRWNSSTKVRFLDQKSRCSRGTIFETHSHSTTAASTSTLSGHFATWYHGLFFLYSQP